MKIYVNKVPLLAYMGSTDSDHTLKPECIKQLTLSGIYWEVIGFDGCTIYLRSDSGIYQDVRAEIFNTVFEEV